MATVFSSPRQRSPYPASAQQPVALPQPIRRLYGGYTVGSPVGAWAEPFIPPASAAGSRAAAAPPRFPASPPQARLPQPARRERELAWLTWQMPAAARDAALLNLRQTLDWRAQQCKPLAEPKTPRVYRRFGVLGEELWPRGTPVICKKLRAELRETIRTVEATQPWLERNRLLAMHSARLGQLSCELEQRGVDIVEKLRGGLGALWVEYAR